MKLKKNHFQRKIFTLFTALFWLVFTSAADIAIFKTIDSSGTLLQTGNGTIFGTPSAKPDETAFDRQTALLQSAINHNRMQLQNTESYLRELLYYLEQLNIFRQQIISTNLPHSQKIRLLNQVEDGQKKTLALYEKYAKIIPDINNEYEILTGRLKLAGSGVNPRKTIPESAGSTIQRQDRK